MQRCCTAQKRWFRGQTEEVVQRLCRDGTKVNRGGAEVVQVQRCRGAQWGVQVQMFKVQQRWCRGGQMLFMVQRWCREVVQRLCRCKDTEVQRC